MSKFLHKLELTNKVGIDATFDESTSIILTLFHVYIQNFIELKPPKNSNKLYEPVLKYVYRHGSDLCEEFGSQRRRDFRSNTVIFFNVNLEVRGIEMILEGKSRV